MYNGEFQFVDVITSPVDVLILNRSEWNAPYWVLREMFFVSLIIYALNYLRNHMKKDSILLIIAAGFIVGYLGVYDVAIACLLGMLLCWFEKDYKKIHTVILLVVGIYVAYRGYFAWVFFCAFIFVLPKVIWLKKLFSSKAMLFLGKISFGIYSFHWPVFCSLGIIIFLKASGAYGAAVALAISGVCTTLVTVGISIVYHYVFEKRIYKMISHI